MGDAVLKLDGMRSNKRSHGTPSLRAAAREPRRKAGQNHFFLTERIGPRNVAICDGPRRRTPWDYWPGTGDRVGRADGVRLGRAIQDSNIRRGLLELHVLVRCAEQVVMDQAQPRLGHARAV